MTQSQPLLQDTDSSPISISAEWSQQYMATGQANNGNLIISSTTPGGSVQLQTGEQILLEVIHEAGWTFAATDTSNWTTVNASTASTSKYYLQYSGTSTLTIPSKSLSFYNTSELASFQSGTPLTVPLTITPPANATAFNILAQLLNSDKSEISYPDYFPVSYIEPGVPLTAFATNPAVVLLTTASTTDFPNTIACALLNQSGSAISSASLTLTLKAWDDNENAVSITQSLGGVNITGDLSWTYNTASTDWTATLSASVSNNNELSINIANLNLNEASIDIVEAELTIANADGHPTYQTSARFQAYGPYTLSLALDSTKSNAKFYTFSDGSSGTFDINPLTPNLNEPPLAPQLLDTANNVVYPPIPGWFSWSKTAPDFVSGYPLKQGANPLYFLVSKGSDAGSSNAYQSLTTCTADLSFYPQQISAAGYQQAYDISASAPKFGPVMPPGAIIMWGEPTIPNGWALCDGTQSPDSNVSVPDLRDKFIMGAGGSEVVNSNGPADTHIHTFTASSTFATTQDGSHTHGMPSVWYNRNLSCGDHTGIDIDSGNIKTQQTQSSGAHAHNVSVDFSNISTSQNSVNSPAYGNRPNWFALCFIIKL